MTDELGREELIRLLKDSFGNNKLDLQTFQCDFPQEEFNNRMEKLNKAEEQIKALIQKPQLTEEWIEEKAKEGIQVFYRVFYYGEGLGKEKNKSTLAENFIRSLIEEIT